MLQETAVFKSSSCDVLCCDQCCVAMSCGVLCCAGLNERLVFHGSTPGGQRTRMCLPGPSCGCLHNLDLWLCTAENHVLFSSSLSCTCAAAAIASIVDKGFDLSKAKAHGVYGQELYFAGAQAAHRTDCTCC